MNEQILKALIELQSAYDLVIWNLNRSLIKIILLAENDGSIPASAFDKALERAGETRGIVEQVETWLIVNYPKQDV